MWVCWFPGATFRGYNLGCIWLDGDMSIYIRHVAYLSSHTIPQGPSSKTFVTNAHTHIHIYMLYNYIYIYIYIYQLSPKTRKSNVFLKNVRFCYWCWNSSACWIWCENLFRHAFLGFLWRSEAGNGSTWDACRVFWHLFLVCLLRNLPSIASCNQPFLFGTVLVFLWGWFFSEVVFFAMMGARLPLWPRSF